MNKKAILFDLDGTLLNTLEDIANAANRVLAAHGFPTHPIQAYRLFIGDGVKILFTRITPPHLVHGEVLQELIREFSVDYGQNYAVKTRLYDGMADILDVLVRKNIKLTIFSNKPHELTLHCASALLSRWSFEAILGATDNLPRKPNPGGALEIARRLDLAPAEFIYLGDSGVDMQTALAAGMLPVGALWGFRTRDELQQNGAQALIERPAEILSFFNGDISK